MYKNSYNQNHVIEQILPKFYLNEFIFGSKLDIDSTNISYNFEFIITSCVSDPVTKIIQRGWG